MADRTPLAYSDIGKMVKELGPRSGRVHLPAAQYNLDRTIEIDQPCVCLEGDVWAYNSDPNGVFESRFGTQLRLRGTSFPALSVGISRTAEGCLIREMGIQGDIVGMDTRPLLDMDRPLASSGLTLSHTRVDQAEFSKLSFCGLQCAVCACDEAEVDACLFERLNVDGCAIGAYFAPRAAYYVRFHKWVAADNPYYGLYVNAQGRQNKGMEISQIQFIRSGGAFEEGDGLLHAAVCLEGLSGSIFRDNLIDDAGMFWYFPPDAKSNSAHETRIFPTFSFFLHGDGNTISGNVISNSHADSMHIRGDRNILMNNVCDRDVVIEGNGNVISNLVLTSPGARLILRGRDNRVWNVPEESILTDG